MFSSRNFNPEYKNNDTIKLIQDITEDDVLKTSFQNQGDELIQNFLKFITSNKEGYDHFEKDEQELIIDNQNHIIHIEKKVQNIKNFYLEQFDLILMKISKLAESQQKIKQIQFNKNQIQELNNLKPLWAVQDKEFKHMLQNVRDIENRFHKLNENSFPNDCIEILQKTIQNISLFQVKNNVDENEVCNLICDEHQEKLTFLDLITKTTKLKRLGCQQCVDSNPQANYQSIISIENQWKQQQSKKLQKMQINFNFLMKKYFYIKEFFNLIKSRIQKSQDQFRMKLDLIQNDNMQKIVNENLKLDRPWQVMSKEELINIGLEINQLNFYDNLYTNQDQTISCLFKETFRTLNHYLQEYANKMIPMLENITSIKQDFQQKNNYQDIQLFSNYEQFTQKEKKIKQKTPEIKQNIIRYDLDDNYIKKKLQNDVSYLQTDTRVFDQIT